jgi:hypothetical protein
MGLLRLPIAVVVDIDVASDLVLAIRGVEVVEMSGVSIYSEMEFGIGRELKIGAVMKMNSDGIVVFLPLKSACTAMASREEYTYQHQMKLSWK